MKKKSMIASILFMGLGQLITGNKVKGAIFALFNILVLINFKSISHGMWGLFTLGETLQKRDGFKVIQGDNSLYLLIGGVITLLILLIYILTYYVNIKDAIKCGEDYDNGVRPLPIKEGIKVFYDRNFTFIMLTPAAIGVMIFVVVPIIVTLFVAFTNYSAPHHIPPANLVDWVGLENFFNMSNQKIWNETFVRLLIWNIIWSVLATLTVYVSGLILALILNRESLKLKKFFRGVFILPWAIPSFVSLLVFNLFFSGLGPINTFLGQNGFEKIPFFTDPLIAKTMIILINIWLGAPYFMMMIGGALTNIDESLYEAAEIDGATNWQQFTQITLPILLFQTAPSLVLTFAFNFNNFGIIYFLTGGGPINPNYRFAGETDLLVTWIFKLTTAGQQFQMASVVSILIFIFVGGIGFWQFSRMKSFKEEGTM